MSYAKDDVTECLAFKLEGSLGEIDQWGHEYVRYVVHVLSRHGRMGAGPLW